MNFVVLETGRAMAHDPTRSRVEMYIRVE
jgi:hypothetical protein